MTGMTRSRPENLTDTCHIGPSQLRSGGRCYGNGMAKRKVQEEDV